MDVPGCTNLREIGRGGFAVVYRARQVRFDRDVAVKVLTRIDLDDALRHRFVRECQAIGSLSWHPGVITVFDAGETDTGQPYLVMEYLADGSLADRLRATGRLPPPTVLDTGVRMAEALAAAHGAGILHRDLKPENLLCDRRSGLRLADFGIAAVTGSTQTNTGAFLGTVAFSAPEVLHGGRATVQSDIYGLASTLYTLATGRRAFEQASDESPLAAVLRAVSMPSPDPSAEGVPPALARVISQGMASQAGQRFPSAAAMAAALRQAQQRLGLPVTPGAAADDDVPVVTRPGGTTVATPMPTPMPAGRYVPRPPPASGSPASSDPPFGSIPPGPPRARRRRRLVAVAAVSAVLIGVLAGAGFAIGTSPDDETTAPSTTLEANQSTAPTATEAAPSTTGPPATATLTTPPETSAPLGPNDEALFELEDIHIADAPAVANLVELWVPQVSAKSEGLEADGIVYDNAAILDDHVAWRSSYPALLLRSEEFPSFRNDGFWVTVIGITFATPEGANAWCDAEGIGADDCFAKRLSYTGSFEGNTVLRG